MQPRRYRQPDKKDGDSMTSFVMESLAGADRLRIVSATGLRDGY